MCVCVLLSHLANIGRQEGIKEEQRQGRLVMTSSIPPLDPSYMSVCVTPVASGVITTVNNVYTLLNHVLHFHSTLLVLRTTVA